MKNVLIISTSLRSPSNSDALAEAFAGGARAAGHQVEKISLIGKELHFCRGCLACLQTGVCVIGDDAREIAQKLAQCDVVVLATPIYYYEMAGQMKTLLDRMNPLYDSDYRFREVYLLAAAAEEEESAMDGAVQGLSGWIECFPKAALKGVVRATGVDKAGAIAGKPFLEQAYTLGQNC